MKSELNHFKNKFYSVCKSMLSDSEYLLLLFKIQIQPLRNKLHRKFYLGVKLACDQTSGYLFKMPNQLINCLGKLLMYAFSHALHFIVCMIVLCSGKSLAASCLLCQLVI